MPVLKSRVRTLLLIVLVAVLGACGGGGGGGPVVLPGFGIHLPQTSLIVVTDSSSQIDVSVYSILFFADDVDLSLIGVPAALGASFSRTTIPSASGAALLTVSAQASATPGDYPITVRGVSGSLTVDRELTITVVQVPPNRFDLDLDVSTITAHPGSSAETMVDLTPIGSFSDTVTLSAVGVPSGLTPSFAPLTVPGGNGQADVTVAVGPGVAPGIYNFTIQGTGGSFTENKPVVVRVPPAPTASGVTLSSPPYASVAIGSSTAVRIGIARAPGVVGDVTLSAVLPPLGLTPTFQPSPCATGGTVMSIQAGAPLAPGLYTLTVQGAAGASSGTTGLLVRVFSSPPAPDAWISRVELAQSYFGESIRLVPGKPALVRAHVLADTGSVTSPKVLLTATQGTSVLGTLQMSGPTTLPTAEDPTTLSTSFTGDLPAGWVVDGVEIKIEVDPDESLTESDELNNAVRVKTTVARATVIDLVIVPIILDGRTGTAPSLHDTLYRNWPLRTVNISVRQAYQVTSVQKVYSNGNGWSEVLSEIAALRASDNSSAYYYGVIRTDYGSGVAGMGYIGFPVAVGMDTSVDVASHELGHNFGLRHAPCGGATGVDASYPYTNGVIGSWGYNLGTGALYSPTSYRDLMSYCNPPWVSDYNYAIVHSRLEPPFGRAVIPAPARPALLVSGTIDRQGAVRLHPLQRVVRPVPVHGPGSHWLVVEPAGGGASAYPFTPVEIGCGPDAGRAAHFALTVSDPGPLSRLAIEVAGRTLHQIRATGAARAAADPSVTLAETGGQLTLRWDDSLFRRATVTHVGATRTTLGLWLEGGRATLPARGLPPGGHFEVNLIDGLEVRRMTLPR
jgi:hypothetical protein